MRLLSVLFAVCAWLAGCSNRPPLAALPRFDRANHADFVCVNNTTQGVLPLSRCRNDIDLNNDVSMFALVTQSARGEVAAVNLETRAVLDSRRDIPGYTFYPVGELPTGIAVPSRNPALTYVADFGSRDLRVLNTAALVIPPTHAQTQRLDVELSTPFGTDPLASFDTSTVWPPPGGVELQRIDLTLSMPEGALPAAPTELRLSPDEDALFVSVQELGLVLYVPLQRCDGSNAKCHPGLIDARKIVSIDLHASIAKIADPPPPPTDAQPSYANLCGYERQAAAPAEPLHLAPDSLTDTPRPSALAFDVDCDFDAEPDCRRRLLIADEALPLIHSIDLDALAQGQAGADAVLAPIVTGAPTVDVTATPRVPRTLDPNDTTSTRYVYAIDAIDGSVMVIEDGRLLNVSTDPNTRPNRLSLGGAGSTRQSALKLAVLTPTYRVGVAGGQYINQPGELPDDGSCRVCGVDEVCRRGTCLGPDDLCIDSVRTEEDPTRLRGVFLSVAMSDGGVRIVDIHDREQAPGPESNTACRVCPPTPVPTIVRHEARFALNFIPAEGEEPITLTPLPNPFAFVVKGAVFPIGSDGSNGSPDAPRLCPTLCSAPLKQVFPVIDPEVAPPQIDADGCSAEAAATDATALLCASENPWGALDERWRAVFEGPLPGTVTGGAQLSEPEDFAPVLLATNAGFCRRGVIGYDDAAADFEGCDLLEAPAADASDQEPKPGKAGDRVVLSNQIPGDYKLHQLFPPRRNGEENPKFKLCAAAAKAMTDDATLQLAFLIRQAFDDRLVIENQMVDPITELQSLADVRDCLGGEAWNFAVYTHGSFTVLGEDSGFVHRIKADANRRCVVDTNADPLLHGRARPGCLFRNRSLQFELRKPSGNAKLGAGIALEIENSNPAVKLGIDLTRTGFSTLTVRPSELRYNDVDRRLYVVDISSRGLVPIPLDPFPPGIDLSNSFN